MISHQITEENFNLEQEIKEGRICPDSPLYARVWADGRKIDIHIGENFADNTMPEKVLLFFWDYAGKRALFVREYKLKKGSLVFEADKTIMLQMRFLKLDTVRASAAFIYENKYFCGYIKNAAGQEYSIEENQQGICKLAVYENSSFTAAWTGNGFLCLKFRDTEKFSREYYRADVSGYFWNGAKFSAYIELPLVCGKPKIKLLSLSSGRPLTEPGLLIESRCENDLRSIWKIEADFSAFSAETSDAYRFVINLDGHDFSVLAKENLNDSNIYELPLSSGEKTQAVVFKDKSGHFSIKTGRVYPYMVSVVTAVYNTAPFLAEMIDSVLTQEVSALEKKLPIEENLSGDTFLDIFEFILVDDGSTDGSGEILDDYAMLSDKIKVIHKENGGVSSARNAGIEAAQGKYITFPDSDDKLGENYFSECIPFFDVHEDELYAVCVPVKIFDAQTGDHWNNYKFRKENRVIDLEEEPDATLPMVNSAFIKSADIKQKRFSTNLKIGEDMEFINDILIKNGGKLGAVSKTSYFYRKRTAGESSAMDMVNSSEAAFIPVLYDCFFNILKNAENTYGYIPKSIQHNVLGQLQWRFAVNDKGKRAINAIGEEKFKEYKQLALSMIKYFDDDVILSQRKIWSEHRYYMFKHKYNAEPELICENDNVYFEFNGTRLTTPLNNIYIRIEFLWIKNRTFHMEGYSMNFDPETELRIYINDEAVEYKPIERDADKYTFDDICMFASTFSVDFPLNQDIEAYRIEFHSILKEYNVVKRDFRYAKTMPLAQSYSKSYYTEDGWTVRRDGNAFAVYNLSFENNIQTDFEGEFINQVNKSKNKEAVKNTLALRKQALQLLSGRNQKRKIWLISDREYAANDNGEALMRYLYAKKDPDIEAYFVIDKNAADYERMKEFGKVVAYGSKQHLLLQLIADYVVSSQGEDRIFNMWHDDYTKNEVIRDLVAGHKFIFLQHGITKDDVSGWLNRYNKRIRGFICAAPREAQSILDYKYYYKPENVWLTGFPRHDRLYHDEKNYITIMPTWRQWLAKDKMTNKPGDDFTESEFFSFYNKLINSEALLSAAEKFGYKVCFMPHPSIQFVIDRFTHDERVNFFTSEKAYSEIFAESNLIMTDYSSSVIDFVLLEKPVVYCQFDKEMFFENHTYKEGYFDYEKDGFGEVTYDMDSLIDVIISYMKNGCRVYEPYKSRMENFFAFHDKNNCERVYKKIKELD